MKKLFTILAVLAAIGFNANADCYLVGEVNNKAWNPQEGTQIAATATSGIYSSEVEITGNGFFGIADMLLTNDDWDYFNNNCRYNPSSKDYPVTLDTDMAMTKGGKDYAWSITPGFYTITVNFNTNTFKMTKSDGSTVVPTVHTFCMVGTDSALGWDLNTAPQLTKSETENVWTITLTSLSGEFQIVRNNDWKQSCRSNGEEIIPNVEYVPAFGDGGEDSNIKLASGVTYNNVTITVTETASNAYSIMMTADDQGTINPVVYTYSLVGDINNWVNDTTAPQFTSQGEGVYTLSIDELSGQFLILRDSDWTKACRSNGEILLPDTPYIPAYGNGGEDSNIQLLSGVVYKDVTITLTETGINSFSILMTAEEIGKVEVPEATYSLTGEFNGWVNDNTAPQFTDNGEGVYTLTLDELQGDFLILRDSDWSKACRSNGTVIELGKLYTPAYGDGGEDSNLSLPAGYIYKNVTITLTYVAADTYTILVTAESENETELPADTFSLVGTTSGWDLATAPQLTQVSDGIWTIYVDELEGEFKIVRNSDWTQALNSNGNTLAIGYDYTPVFGQGGEDSNIKLPELTLYKGVSITVSTTNQKDVYNLFVSADSSEPITPPADVFAIVGEFNNWDLTSAPTFSHNEGVWTLDIDQLYGQFLIVRNGDWNQALRTNGSELSVGTEYVPTFGQGGEDSNIALPVGKTYIGVTLTITSTDTDVYSLLMSAEKELSENEAVYELTGDFNDWELGTAYFTETAEGVYELSLDTFEGGFKVVKNGSFATQYGANHTGVMFQANMEYQLNTLSDNADIIYTSGSYTNVKFTLKIDENETASITMTGTDGVAAVDMDSETEYFNMQGLRIDNPEKGGIYIVKRGSKVSKITLK